MSQVQLEEMAGATVGAYSAWRADGGVEA